jgi:LacI family transcriptional regulator
MSRKPVQIRGGRDDGEHRHVLFVTDFYLEEVLAGVVSYASKAGWRLNANMRFHGMFPPLTEPCDGILATAGNERVRNWLAKWKGCPIVRVSSTRLSLPYPAVEADYKAAGQAGARHLLELGHVHFAFYHLADLPESQEAWNGFQAELAATGREARRLNLSVAHPGRDSFHVSAEERHRWLAGELQRRPKPLAVMCDDDRRSLELLAACEMAGLRVPEDVAILGCDNHWVETGMARIPLSSVDMNFKGAGWEAAALLDGLMQGNPPQTTLLRVPPTGVVARRSTATFVTDAPGITLAVVYLREHFSEPLRLAGLAKMAGMSERVFQLEFKKQVGRSAREEIQRCRLSGAARLLRDSGLKLKAIAMESGFGSAGQLCRFFVRAYGSSPNVWREKMKGGQARR